MDKDHSLSRALSTDTEHHLVPSSVFVVLVLLVVVSHVSLAVVAYQSGGTLVAGAMGVAAAMWTILAVYVTWRDYQ